MNEATVYRQEATWRIRLASVVGTTVEFYDFYIFATAATQIFGQLFFSRSTPANQLLAAYGTFGIAFLARPLGGAVFGHVGDRIGRKTSLVISLLLMGGPTALTGLLPTYDAVGWIAPVMLCILRFGQGLAIGGEWAGAALMAVESAPPGWRGRFGMFAPLGVPFGYMFANGLLLVLSVCLTPDQFRDWGWRIAFILSAPLVWFGLWIRIHLTETPVFSAAIAKAKPARVPLVEVIRSHFGQVVVGALGAVSCFAIYYIATVFALGYGTAVIGIPLNAFLVAELGAHVFMIGGVVLAGWRSDRWNPSRVLTYGFLGTMACGFLLPAMLASHSLFVVFVFLSLALFVMGFNNGPLGAWLPGLFPARVRYSGVSAAFNIGGIIGGALTPLIAQTLAARAGLVPVGLYLAFGGLVSLVALDISARREAHRALSRSEARYRTMFEQTHVSMTEVDLSPARSMLARLQELGVTDLQAQMRDDPGLVAACARRIQVTNANDAAMRLLECDSRDQVLGPIARFMPPGDDALTYVLSAMWSGTSRFEREVQLRTRTGRPVTLLLIVALPEDEGASDRVVFAMVDITARERARDSLIAAREELARAGRATAVGAVSASIAHELKQPLGALAIDAQGCMRWLTTDPPNLDEAKAAAQRTVKQVIRAAEIVDRTRSHLTRSRRPLESVHLAAVVHDVAALFERELTGEGIVLRIDAQADAAPVAADEIEMQQVLANILTNGIRASCHAAPARRELTIRIADDASGWVRLSVRDTGAGIADEHLACIFEPFFTPRPDGMGMGLAICRSMVEVHGGSLAAHNHPEGGAVFEIRLPPLRAAVPLRPASGEAA
ncbi:MFS transporter [Paraburkholderia sp. C35]|uniref:MFS transporter n=1 Tax=Paraburkholderia sp. C35 TaxID=2126993 RepID=UPI000D68B8F5|nr:MFS transporter [Paraburkholderia sp. C35]